MQKKKSITALLLFAIAISVFFIPNLQGKAYAASTTDNTYKLESVNYPGSYIRHYRGEIKKDYNVSPPLDAEWRIVPGLYDNNGYVSFEAVNYPGYYIRHKNSLLYSHEKSTDTTYLKDATFKEVAGLSGTGVSYQSYNYPNMYIRHQNGRLKISTISSSTDRQDATFTKSLGTASATKGTASTSYVQQTPAGYVMSYFKDNDTSLYFAYSTDALNWTALSNKPVLTATQGTKQIRDPYIFRKRDGKFVVMSTEGWNNSEIYLWDSDDLVKFTNERLMKVNTFDTGQAWAPECIYDPDNDRYVIYWSAAAPSGQMKTYSTTTTDFVTFSTPRVFFDPGYSIIDSDIVKQNGVYYLYFKDERGDNDSSTPYKALKVATSTTLEPGSFTVQSSNYITDHLTEGPAAIKSLTSNTWYLYYDYFMNGGVWGCSSNTDITNPNGWTKLASNQFSLPSGVRHGNAIAVTQDELNRIKGTNRPTFTDTFDVIGGVPNYTGYAGTWYSNEGNLIQASTTYGAKLVSNSGNYADMTYSADVFIPSSTPAAQGDAGLIFRVTNPAVGQDSFYGYYAGINAVGKEIFLGQMDYGWHLISHTSVSSLATDTWYNLKVVATSGTIKVYLNNTLYLTSYDTNHLTGSIGVRSHRTDARFDNLSVSQ